MSKLTQFNDAAMSAKDQDNTQGALFFGWLFGGFKRRKYGYGGHGNHGGCNCGCW